MNKFENYFASMKNGISEFIKAPKEAEINDYLSKNERYENLGSLASGGMKRIVKVKDLNTGKILAKAILNDESSQAKELFLRETDIMSELSHPNIVNLHDLGEDDHGPWFTMELLNGRNLADIDEAKPLIELLDIYLKVCDAVIYAHSKNIIHLDIKPENIIVGEFGEVCLCDWGVAKRIGSEDMLGCEKDFNNNLTLHGEIKGTPGFMAPEQIMGQEKTVQTDIFSLGCLLYSLMEQKAPFREDDLEKTLTATLNGELTFERTPEALKAVILKCLQQDAEYRYRTAVDLKREVESYLAGFATEAENAGFIKQLILLYRRNKTVSNIVLLSLSLLIIGSQFFIYQLQKSEEVALGLKDKAEKEAYRAGQAKNESEKNLELYIRGQKELRSTEEDHAEILKKYSWNLQLELNFGHIVIVNDMLKEDPHNKWAWAQKGYYHFINLEFKECIPCFEKAGNETAPYKELYELASGYKTDGVPSNDLRLIMRSINDIGTQVLIILNLKDKISKNRLAPLVKIVLCKLNKTNDLNFKFDYQNRSLDLSNNSKLRRIVYKKKGLKGVCLLEVLDVKQLNLSNTPFKEFWGAKTLTELEILDLSKTKINMDYNLLDIKSLKTLYISRLNEKSRILDALRNRGVKIILVD